MFWNEDADATSVMPSKTAALTTIRQYFQDGNPRTGQLATVVKAEWLNTVVNELCNILDEIEIIPDKMNDRQLALAIRTMIENSLNGKMNGYVPDTRLIDTKLPLKGGGTLAKDLILSILSATTLQEGVVKRATDEMAKLGIDEECYITPKQLLAALSSIGNGGDGSGPGEDGGDGSDGNVLFDGLGTRLFISQVSGEWVVPAGVYQILITLTGAGRGGRIEFDRTSGASTYGDPLFYGGDAGGTCIGSKKVTPGETIPFVIGAGGESVSRYIVVSKQVFGGGEPGGNSTCLDMIAIGGGQSGDVKGGQINLKGGESGFIRNFLAGGSLGVGSYWPGAVPCVPIWQPSLVDLYSSYKSITIPIWSPILTDLYGYECTVAPGHGGGTFFRGGDGIIAIQY